MGINSGGIVLVMRMTKHNMSCLGCQCGLWATHHNSIPAAQVWLLPVVIHSEWPLTVRLKRERRFLVHTFRIGLGARNLSQVWSVWKMFDSDWVGHFFPARVCSASSGSGKCPPKIPIFQFFYVRSIKMYDFIL